MAAELKDPTMRQQWLEGLDWLGGLKPRDYVTVYDDDLLRTS